MPVDRETGAGQRGASERALIHSHPAIGKARDIPLKHFKIGQQMMAERHRLGDLEMGEARHHRVGMLLGALDEGALKPVDGAYGLVACSAHPQAEVRRDLVVAGARRVQPPGGRPDQFGEPMLDRHVDVLELDALGHAIALELFCDLVEAFEDGRRVCLSDDPLISKHRSVGFRRRNILAPQPLVERD